MPRNTPASTPSIRPRGRPALAEATTAPVAAEDNNVKLTADLDALLTKAAIANTLKNKGTREEKKAKGDLEKLLNANELTSHETLVEFPDKSRTPYRAEIAPGSQDYVDMRELAAKCGVKVTGSKDAQEMFFAMIGTSFKAVEDALGGNVLAQVKKTRSTLPAISFGVKKD